VISPGQECGRCDALYSFMRDVPLGIRTGDCVPVLIAHRNGKWVTGIHAGWRGTRARIVQKVLREILKHPKAKGDQPSDCVAAIGPAIGPCCYQVSAELEKDFKSEFSQAGKYFQSLPNRCLDLPALNEWQLKEAGVQEVDLIRACTFCSQSSNSSESAFHSYRRNANTDRQWSVILKR
jgi:YfiH family protein